jgi:hypothetical protein
MGKTIKKDGEIFYQQDDGEITARLTGFEEIDELSHEGSEKYKKVFYILVAAGGFYLGLIFWGIV